ncbi:MAG: hypothetical protein WCK34_00770 [Bacteroidota bacterium]
MDSIILYVNSDFIAGAAIADGKIHILKPVSEDRFWLYFHLDETSKQVKYGSRFKKRIFSNDPFFCGDPFTKISNNEKLYFNGKDSTYLEILKGARIMETIVGLFHPLSKAISQKIPLYISFSDELLKYGSPAIHQFLMLFEHEEVELQSYELPFTELFCNFFKNSFSDQDVDFGNKQIILIDALNKNLNLSVLSIPEAPNTARKDEDDERPDGSKAVEIVYDLFTIVEEKTFKNLGNDPYEYAIVSTIFDSLESYVNVYSQSYEIDFQHQLFNADEYVQQLRNVENVRINVTISDRNGAVALNKAEIERKTKNHISSVLEKCKFFIEDSKKYFKKVDTQQLVIFLGDIFFKPDFRIKTVIDSEFGRENVNCYGTDELYEALKFYQDADIEHYRVARKNGVHIIYDIIQLRIENEKLIEKNAKFENENSQLLTNLQSERIARTKLKFQVDDMGKKTVQLNGQLTALNEDLKKRSEDQKNLNKKLDEFEKVKAEALRKKEEEKEEEKKALKREMENIRKQHETALADAHKATEQKDTAIRDLNRELAGEKNEKNQEINRLTEQHEKIIRQKDDQYQKIVTEYQAQKKLWAEKSQGSPQPEENSHKLKKENEKLKTMLRLGGILLAVVGILLAFVSLHKVKHSPGPPPPSPLVTLEDTTVFRNMVTIKRFFRNDTCTIIPSIAFYSADTTGKELQIKVFDPNNVQIENKTEVTHGNTAYYEYFACKKGRNGPIELKKIAIPKFIPGTYRIECYFSDNMIIYQVFNIESNH